MQSRIQKSIVGFLLLCPLMSFNQTLFPEEHFPIPRDKPSFIFDARNNVAFLFGSSPMLPDSSRCDVWKLEGKEWTKIGATGPGARAFFPGANRTSTKENYFFGGVPVGIGSLDMQHAKDDVWMFDGNTWRAVAKPNAGIRHHHHMVYADHLDSFVIYGEFNSDGADTLTWLLKNGKFTAMNIPGPGVRYHSGMAYDKHRKKVVLYGGGDHLSDHYEFDGKKWIKITTEKHPGPKRGHVVIYNTDLKMVVLHGGWPTHNARDPENDKTPIIWGWDGSTWKRLAEERIFSAALTYDPKRKVMVAYGLTDNGHNGDVALWELKKGSGWIRVADYGAWDRSVFLKRRTDANPNDSKTLELYGYHLRTEKQYHDAEEIFRKLDKNSPRNKKFQSLIAEVLVLQGRIGEANSYLEKIASGSVNKHEMFVRLADALAAARAWNDATVYYEKALTLAPRAREYYNVACMYALLQNNDKAYRQSFQSCRDGILSTFRFETDVDLERLKTDLRWDMLLEQLK